MVLYRELDSFQLVCPEFSLCFCVLYFHMFTPVIFYDPLSSSVSIICTSCSIFLKVLPLCLVKPCTYFLFLYIFDNLHVIVLPSPPIDFIFASVFLLCQHQIVTQSFAGFSSVKFKSQMQVLVYDFVCCFDNKFCFLHLAGMLTAHF